MAVPGPGGEQEEDAHDEARELVEHSYLTYVAPFATDLDIEAALRQAGADHHKPLSEAIQRREWLFFGTLSRPDGQGCGTHVWSRLPTGSHSFSCSFVETTR